jgi:hypothetical protein
MEIRREIEHILEYHFTNNAHGGGRVSCKATALPREVHSLYLHRCESNLKDLRLYDTIVGESDRQNHRMFQVRFEEILMET